MNPYYSGPPSDHFDGVRFFNPDGVDTDRSIRDLLRWKLKETAAPWPRSVPVHQAVPDASVPGLRVTVVGHASVLIQVADGLNVLTGPHMVGKGRASDFPFAGPRVYGHPGSPSRPFQRSMPYCSVTITTTIWIWRRCADYTSGTTRSSSRPWVMM